MSSQDELDRIGSALVGTADKRYSPEYYLLRYRLKQLTPFCRGPKVLEMGCASGEMTKELATQFADLHVVEGSPLLIEEARNYVGHAKVQYHCSLFEEFQPTQKFDDIILSHVIEHLEQPANVLRKASSWLVPGGRIHVLVPNAGALNRRVGVAMGMLKRLDELHAGDLAVGHLRSYDWVTLAEDVRAAGLEVQHMDGVMLKPLANSQMEDWDIQLLDALFEVGRELPAYCSEIYVMCGLPQLCK